MGNLSSTSNKKIIIFTGVPVDDAATLFRAGLVAQKLTKKGYRIIFTSVSGNFEGLKESEVSGLPVRFIGQAHYFAQKPFSSRQRLGMGKNLIEIFKTTVRFAKILGNEKPDRVMVVTSMPSALVAGLAAKILGFKTLIDLEDLTVGQMEASGYPRLGVGFYIFIEKIWLRIFDKIIVCSNYLKDRYPGSIIVPNMIEIKDWGGRKNIRKKQIVFVGQMGPYHGQTEALLSLEPFLRKNKEWRLLFVGGGETGEKLKVKSEKLKVKNQVAFTGQVPQSEVAEFLACSTIGLLPLWDSPVHKARHPLKLLEYLAAGLVVVTNKVGEAAGIVKDGENGFLCPAGDMECLAKKIEMVANNPTLAQKISKAARFSVGEFSSGKVMGKWVEILNA